MLVLVLEASTASAKAMIYDDVKGVIDVLDSKYSSDAGEVTEYDADKIVYETLIIGKKILDKNNIKDIDIVATSSIWGHSLVLLDENKNPISKLKTWADTSASITTQRYRGDKIFHDYIYQRTGCPIHSTYTLWKYVHEKLNNDVTNARYIASLPEYLFLKLTGEFAISKSTASAEGFLNIHKLEWDKEILKFAEVTEDMLAKLVESEYTAPLNAEAANILGVKSGIPVLITGADGCMNHVAAGAFRSNVMTISVGTSAAIRITVEKPTLSQDISTWCYAGVEGKWVLGSAIAGAGNCVYWLLNKVIRMNDLKDLIELEKEASKFFLIDDAPIFLPFIAGERCPGWDDTRRGMLVDIDINHNIYNIFYSILEGVLFNLRQSYEIMMCLANIKPDLINISGGIEKSNLWLQLAANIFNRTIYVDGLLHSSMLGAAYMALKALGKIRTVTEIVPIQKYNFNPIKDKNNVIEKRYQRYLDYYRVRYKEGD